MYANWLVETEDLRPEPELPAVVLVVSGAHSDLVLMEAHRRFRPLGRTIDDAAGEAFDKVARLLHLGFKARCVKLGPLLVNEVAGLPVLVAFRFPQVLELDIFIGGMLVVVVVGDGQHDDWFIELLLKHE